MESAYVQAAGLTGPDATELGDGGIGGLTLEPGLYTWSFEVNITTDLYLAGTSNSDDTWIFQIAESLVQASGVNIT
ncbi:MAG: hypothetical protein ACJAWL_003301 [Motiliproteus sp.]|jgi:hypothetical protein